MTDSSGGEFWQDALGSEVQSQLTGDIDVDDGLISLIKCGQNERGSE